MSGSTAIPLSSDQEKQNLLESLRFGDGSTFKELSYGKGRIFWAAYLVELAEGTVCRDREEEQSCSRQVRILITLKTLSGISLVRVLRMPDGVPAGCS